MAMCMAPVAITIERTRPDHTRGPVIPGRAPFVPSGPRSSRPIDPSSLRVVQALNRSSQTVCWTSPVRSVASCRP